MSPPKINRVLSDKSLDDGSGSMVGDLGRYQRLRIVLLVVFQNICLRAC